MVQASQGASVLALILLVEAEIKQPNKGHRTDQGPWSVGHSLFDECKREAPATAPVKTLLHCCVEGPDGALAWLHGQPEPWALGTCKMLSRIHQLDSWEQLWEGGKFILA